jgi:hypothetical protein
MGANTQSKLNAVDYTVDLSDLKFSDTSPQFYVSLGLHVCVRIDTQLEVCIIPSSTDDHRGSS